MAYTPPDGLLLKFDFREWGYEPPAGDQLAFDFRSRGKYYPPRGRAVALDFKGGPYTPPAGANVALEFAPAESGGGSEQWLFPSSWASSAFGSATVSNWTNYIRPATWASQLFGAHSIANKARLLRPSGWASQALGTAQIRNNSADIRPTSIQAGAVFGTAWASLWARTVRAQGWRSDVHGLGRAYNLKQTIGQAGNIGSKLAFGTAQAYNLDRTLKPSGALGTVFGTASITLVERKIFPPPIPAPSFGTAWASHSPRMIAPAGLYATRTGLAKVGGTRFLHPEGFDAARYGTRVIPEIQTIYPQGMVTVWGTPLVYNARQQVKPAGFVTNGSEDARFGSIWAYNLRRLLQPFHSEASQAIGEVFGQWTAIANRNRLVQAYGFDAALLPRQYVENKARAVLPGGGVASAYGNPFVSLGVRQVRPEAIEAPYISGWTVLYNDARVLRPASIGAEAWGTHAIQNTRRRFERIGNWDSLETGTPFVDFARREITFETRYAIQPPQIPLPVVDTWTKYVDAAGAGDQSGTGWAYLEIHWNKLYPRTGDLSRYGMPTVRNVTPELLARGRDHQEHGTPTVMLMKRFVTPSGMAEPAPGRPHVRDRRTWVYPTSQNFAVVSNKATVQNLQPDPPTTQWVFPYGGSADNHLRMGEPALNQRVIYPTSSTAMTRFGDASVKQNVLRVEPGIYDYFAIGTPFVSLRNRRVEPEGIRSALDYGQPRLTPHTIWATEEATDQAVENHGRRRFHPVDFPPGVPPLQGMGTPRVRREYDTITSAGGELHSRYGTPRMVLKRHYIRPEGWRLSRVGWHEIPEFIRTVTQYAGPRTDVFGTATVKRAPYTGPQYIRPAGFAGALGAARVEFFNRELRLAGWNSQAMGASGGGPTYMRQRLWVGAPDWPKMQGFDAALFGQQWISLRVRELKPAGWDSFVMDYDLQNFDLRMRVRRPFDPGPAAQTVGPLGWAADRLGVPDARHRTHFIRPDGNADQFRKGGLTWQT